VSRLGAHRGHASAVRSNRSGNNGRLWVRSEGQLSRKSSKRIQTGEPIGISRPPAICLMSLRAFQTFLRDWPHLSVTPAWTRTLYPTSVPQTNRRWPTMSANFRMGDHPLGARTTLPQRRFWPASWCVTTEAHISTLRSRIELLNSDCPRRETLVFCC
jgi:hypothetical protein